MTQLLLRCITRGSAPEDPRLRGALGKMAGMTGIGCNLLLFLGKLLAGLSMGAVSVIADAFNNLSDAASSLVTLLGFKLGQRPADSDHPYGHARYEYLAATAVSVLILLMGFELAKSALEKLLHPAPTDAGLPGISMLLISIGLKFWMSRFYQTVGSLISSAALGAAALDSRSDMLATSAVLLGCLAEKFLGWHVDGLLGLAVACCILWAGLQSIKETVSPLLGQRADTALTEKITDLVLSHESILGIHDLLIHDYGPSQCFASLHAELSADLTTIQCHDIVDDIEQDALEKLGVHLVIHCDPVLTESPEQEKLNRWVSGAARRIDPRLSVHDCRLADHEGTATLVFDLEIPYDLEIPQKLLQGQMEEALRRRGVTQPITIHFDRKL